jgi:transglutaminase-like putative cysteine protease
MTASAFSRSWSAPMERIRLRPAEGWLTVLMVIVLVEAFAWSLINAAWIPANQGEVGYLSYLAFGGVLVEFLGAKAGLNRWLTHVIGAILMGLLLPIVAGAAVLGAAGAPIDLTNVRLLYQTSGEVAFRVWADLVRDGRPFTSQFGHYHMVFAALVWAAGMAASSAVFSRRRPFDAVIVMGLLLIANMSVTVREEGTQLAYLVIFTIAALILLVRAHTFEEQITWIRRRIGDPATVAGLYLQGGAWFVAGAVLGALILMTAASSDPLAGLWTDVPSRLTGLSDLIQRFAPPGGQPRPIGAVGFGSSATTSGLWSPTEGNAFVASIADNELNTFKWRVGTYATYDGIRRWTWNDTQTEARPAGSDVLADSPDSPAGLADRKSVSITITPDHFSDATIVGPAAVSTVDRDTTLVMTNFRFTVLQFQGGGSYKITASIPIFSQNGGITQNALRQSPRNYPDDAKGVYLDIPEGTIGPKAQAVYDAVLAQAGRAPGPAGNPYDFAATLQSYLRSPANFEYGTDVRSLSEASCGGTSTIECFATIRKGYCEYYAGLMTMLLRKNGIPARIAYGFLPGNRGVDGVEVVPASAAHWWVEAYFTDFGWIEFDPTGGVVGQPQAIPPGGTETPRPLPSFGTPRPRNDLDRGGLNGSIRPGGVGSTAGGGTQPGNPAALAVVVFMLSAAVLLALVTARRRRSPALPMDPDHAWGGIGRLANRFGLGPRPTQTVYEYAGALGDAVPMARAELQTVARAKVEVAYGRQTLGPDRLKAVGAAYRRLRLAIFRRGVERAVRRRR